VIAITFGCDTRPRRNERSCEPHVEAYGNGGVPLGGAGAGNGSFATGEVYTVGAAVDLIFRNGYE